MNVDLKLLQHAVVLAQHRHFGRAAAALRVSQPTLSRSIAALERRLGIVVFERSRRDVVATPIGREVLGLAGELVARATAVAGRLTLLRDGRAGRLRIAAGAYISDIVVQPAVIDTIKDGPALRLELLEREWSAALALLTTGQVDFAVLDAATLDGLATLHVEPLGALQGAYFCRAGHPLTTKTSLTVDDLRAFPFVMPDLASQRAGLIEDIDAGHTVEGTGGRILPSIAVSSVRIARDIVAATDAIGLDHASRIVGTAGDRRFALLDLAWRGALPVVEFAIASMRDCTPPPAARELIARIRRRMRQVEHRPARTSAGARRRPSRPPMLAP